MNKFIVWDEDEEKFIPFKDVEFSKDAGDDFLIVHKDIGGGIRSGRIFDTFDYIGKKDINDKKIYADSSIVEFEWDGKYLGYFSFDKEELRYKIEILEHPKKMMFRTFDFDQYSITNLKIIDTIQENKLGLMK